VLLGEPPPMQGDLRFQIFGIPVRIHPFFWLVALLLGYRSGDPASVLIWVVALFLSILVHELGHAMAMRAYGFRPWITLYGLGGLTGCDQAYSHRSRGSESLGQILISAAGPAAGFLLAALLLLGVVLAGHGENIFFDTPLGLTPVVSPQVTRIDELLNSVFFICVLWGLVNLLPIYPLDGGQIAREVLLNLSPRDGIRSSLTLSVLAAGAMALVGLVLWKSFFVTLMFGYLAYASFAALQAYGGRNPW